MTAEWPAIHKNKCMEKYDHGPFIHDANCYLRDCLCDDKLEITVTEVLHARTLLSRNKSPSGDHIVPEMILALPLIICYDVATLFDDKFQHGGGSNIQRWHELLLCFIKKVARPKEFVDLLACHQLDQLLCQMVYALRTLVGVTSPSTQTLAASLQFRFHEGEECDRHLWCIDNAFCKGC